MVTATRLVVWHVLLLQAHCIASILADSQPNNLWSFPYDTQQQYANIFRSRDISLDEQIYTALNVLEIEDDYNRSRNFTILSPTYDFITYQYRDFALQDLASIGDDQHVVLTLAGYDGEDKDEARTNQDRGIVIVESDTTMIQGVMDGHGSTGQIVAEFCQEELSRRILQLVRDSDASEQHLSTRDISEGIVSIFEQVESEIPHKISVEGGASASMALLHNSHVYLINTGDAQTWIAGHMKKNTHVLQSTRIDLPTDPSEYERLTKLGVEIEDGFVDYADPDTGDEYMLKMSRVIGDDGATGVIATPSIQVWSVHELQKQYIMQYCHPKLPQHVQIGAIGNAQIAKQCNPDYVDLFVMSTTDGILDYLSIDDMSYDMAAAFFPHDNDVSAAYPLLMAQALIEEASNGWESDSDEDSRDDMVIAASRLTNKKNSVKR